MAVSAVGSWPDRRSRAALAAAHGHLLDLLRDAAPCGVPRDPELAQIQKMKFAAFFQNHKQPPTEDDGAAAGKARRIRYVSDLWVRCCLASDCVVSHQAHELFTVTYQQPRSMFPVALPLPCFKRVVASTSVYFGVDRLVVMELLHMAGAQVSPKLSKKNTHLICLNPLGMKYEKAREWGLTIVTARWVVQSVLQGELLDASLPEFQVVDEDVVMGGDTSSSGSRTTLGSMSGSRTTLGSMDPARAGNGEPASSSSQEWMSRRTSTSM